MTDTWSYEGLLHRAYQQGISQILTDIDPVTGIQAFIALHSTDRGPAIGGTRFITYPSPLQALEDVILLATAMAKKAKLANLPHGGAKSVIIHPNNSHFDRQRYLEHFARFVDSVGGRYIAAVDMGTTTADMEILATQTPYVVGAKRLSPHAANPGSYTAQSVYACLLSAIESRFQQTSPKGLRVAIQGTGSVGSELARLITQAGGHIVVCDAIDEKTSQLKARLNCDVCSAESIYAQDCDIFMPCAGGGVLTEQSVNQLRCQIVVGSANNPLASAEIELLLQQKGILYITDFLANAGGLIQASTTYNNLPPERCSEKISQLTATTTALIHTAMQLNCTITQAIESNLAQTTAAQSI